MKTRSLSLAVIAVAFLLSVNARPSQAVAQRVIVAPTAYRTTFVRPILPLYRQRVYLQSVASPIFVSGTTNYAGQPVVLIPQQPNWGYVPTAVAYRSVGTWTYVGW